MSHQNRKKNLLVACSRGEYAFLKEYIQKYNERNRYQIYDNHSWGPLHHAVVSNSLECVDLLLKCKLVDVRWKSYEGQTCLYVGVDRAVSCSIIKLLLETDPELFDIPDNENFYPIHKAISRNSLVIVQAMIETLNALDFEIKDQFDWEDENGLLLAARQKNLEMVNYIVKNIKCDVRHTNDNNLDAASIVLLSGDSERNADAFEIFTTLIPLCYQLNTIDSMERLMQPLVFASYFENHLPYNWMMENFYLVEWNEHHDLVRRALITFKGVSFNYRLIVIGLHSLISQYIVRQDDQLKNEILYQNIIIHLRDIFKHDKSLFTDIAKVLQSKLHLESLKYSIMKFIPSSDLHGTEESIDFMHIFSILHIGDMIDIGQLLFFTPSITFLNNIFLLFMPFSNAITADQYLKLCTKDRPALLASIEKDLELSKFCMTGNFRKENTLKSMCRQVIRRSISESKKNRLFDSLITLSLPNKLVNYLLFNYTGYEFNQ